MNKCKTNQSKGTLPQKFFFISKVNSIVVAFHTESFLRSDVNKRGVRSFVLEGACSLFEPIYSNLK